MMKLIGSVPSPYTRRLRLWMPADSYEFESLGIILDGPGRAALEQYTPAMKIPVLLDADVTVYDSRVIYNYLNAKWQRETLSWEEQNNLTLIDAANDAFVTLLMLTRSDIDTTTDSLIARLQKERIDKTLQVLSDKVKTGEFAQWQYPAICLYCLLDWIDFRELYNLEQQPALKVFRDSHCDRPQVEGTNPRQSS